MKPGKSTILLLLIIVPWSLFGQTVTGPVTPCIGYPGNVYVTQQFMTNYTWSVSPGGVITAGGSSTDYSATITWNTTGPQTVSVSYTGGTGTGVLNIDVQPTYPVSVSVVASSDPLCAGMPVTFTANTTNGGSNPVYTWFVNGVNVGANSANYTYMPANNDIVYCQVLSDLPCTTGNPATSPQLTVAVTPVVPVSVLVVASSNPSCAGVPVNFTANPDNGGATPGYQWYLNGFAINGATNNNYSLTPVNGDVIACQLMSSLGCVTGNPAMSSPVMMTISPVLPVSVAISPSGNPVCVGSQVLYTATPVNGGTNPGYSWLVNGINAGTNNPVMAWTPANGDQVQCVLNSNESCKSGNPAYSNVVDMTVEFYQPVNVSIVASENPVCNGSPVTLTATPANGGSAPHYQWTVNGVSIVHDNPVYTYIPDNGDVVICYLTSSLLCTNGNPATSNAITLSVSPSIVSTVTISASANPTCAGTPVTLTAHPVNAGSSPAIEWFVNSLPLGTGMTFTFIPVNGDVVYCQMQSAAMCSQSGPVVSNQVTFTVSPSMLVGVSISVSVNPVCQGSNVVFTALGVNGGVNPLFEWFINGQPTGLTGATFLHSPVNGEIVTCKLTSSLNCAIANPAISNPVTMVVSSALPVSVSVVPSQNPACQGQTVTFTATGMNGGATPVYTWLVNNVTSGSGDSLFSYNPTDGDQIKCYLNSAYACATGNPALSNVITMAVNSVVSASVSIATPNNPSCQGTLVTYTATPVNGGTTPSYQWRVNGLNSGTNSSGFSFVPENGNAVDCQMTSSLACPVTNPVTSNSVTHNVNPILPAGISITASSNPVCLGTQVTFTANPVNGGSSPTYQWKRNGIPAGTGQIMIYTPVNGDVLTCQLTSSLMCVSGNQITSNPITMVVSSAMTPAITITASSNPFCEGSTVNFTSSIQNGGPAPVYQWLKNGVAAGTGPGFSLVPQDGDFITCKLTSSLACASPNPATSNPVLLLKNKNLPVSVSITVSENPVCSGSGVTFTAHPVNGGFAPVYQWKVNGINKGINSALFYYTPVTGGEIVTCVVTSNALCTSGNPATSNAITLVATTNPTASVSVSTSTNPFCTGSAVTFNASATNGGSAPVFVWKVNGLPLGGNSPSMTYTPYDGDVVICEMTSSASCISGIVVVSDPPIVMSGSANLPLSVLVTESANPVCQGTSVAYTATPVNGGATPAYQWKVNNLPVGANSPVYTYVPANTDQVTCRVSTSMVCATPSQKTSDPVVMVVQTPPTASITISASSNPVCQGSAVVFTSVISNGGSNPVYQWRVNGLVVGSNLPTYTFTPVNGDVVTATLTSSASCVTSNPVVSNSVALVVGTEQPVSVSISASENPFCVGSQIVYEATPVNGGSNPVYSWFVNGTPAGVNNPVLLYTPANGDLISCLVTSNQSCITNNPATSNFISMVATSAMPVNVNITASSYTCCAGTLVQYTASVTNGGVSPTYHWKVNGVSKGTNYPIYQYAPLNGDVVMCVVNSNLPCATNNPDTSNLITMVVNPSAPVSINITASCNPCCQGSAVTYNATAINPGSDPLYRWKVNGVIMLGSGSTTFTYIPVDGDVVLCRLTSDQLCATNNPANSNSITMNILPYGAIGVSIAASGNPVCQGTQVTFTATPTNGGVTPGYQWKVNGMNQGTNQATFSYYPANGDVVTCTMTSNASCILTSSTTSNAITMTVSPLVPVSVYIVPSANPVCQGSVTFNATPTNGGPMPSYQWKVNGITSGGGGPVFTYPPANGDAVSCLLTSSAACVQGNPALSNSVVLNVVQSFPVSVSVVASAMPDCQGSQITYTATPVNGGANPTFQWMVNGIFIGSNSPVFSYTPNNGDVIVCQLTSSLACPTGNPAVSDPVVMNFSPVLPVSISISCSSNPACLGPPAVFTASAQNAGTAPVYSWKVNGVDMGVNLPVFSYTPSNGDIVVCVLHADIPCPLQNPVTSNTITMSVLPPQLAGITINTSNTTVCAGALVSFSATAINQGSAPVYTWMVNGITSGTNSNTFSYIPLNGDQVTCQLSSSISCITNNPVLSNSITMTVGTEFPASINISASSNPSCIGENVTFTANAINGGSNPEYHWMLNGFNVGTNSPVYTTTPSTGQVVSCQLLSSFSCATGSPASSNPITMTVNPVLPVSAVITSSLNPACIGIPITFTATAVNGGSSPAYQWKTNGVNIAGATSAIYTFNPANSDVVTCQVTSSAGCTSGNPAVSNAITMMISSSFNAAVTIVASDNPICVNTPVTFTATPVFGGPSPFYQWKVNGVNAGSNNPVFTYYPDNGDLVTCVMTSSLTCAPLPVTSNTILMFVLPVPVSVTITANPNTPVCAGTLMTFTASPVNGGPTPTYQWKVNGVNNGPNNPIFSYAPASGDTIKCMLMSNATCAMGSTAVSNEIIPVVNPNLPVSITINHEGDPVCEGTLVAFTSAISNGGSMPFYQWQVNGSIISGATNGSYAYTPVNNDEIICSLTSNAVCAVGSPAISNLIRLAVFPNLTVGVSLAVSQNPLCEGEAVYLTALPVNGGTSPAFQWKLNGTAVNGATNSAYSYLPSTNDYLTCELISSVTCPVGNPASATPVVLTVNPLQTVSITISTPVNPVCAGSPVTCFATAQASGSNPLFQWLIRGNAISGATNSSYTFTPVDGDTITCQLTSSEVCTQANPVLSAPLILHTNPILPVDVSILPSQNPSCQGNSVIFTSSIVNGGSSPGYQWKINHISVSGATNTTFSCNPDNHDTITCLVNSNAVCTTGNPAESGGVIMTVNPTMLTGVAISANPSGTFCDGTSVVFTAVGSNAGNNPLYEWRVNGIVTGGNLTQLIYNPLDGDVVQCQLTSGELCAQGNPALSNTIVMQVNSNFPVGVTITASPPASVCAGTSVEFTAIPVNGGGSPLFQWFVNGNPAGGNSSVYSFTPVGQEEVYCKVTSDKSCVINNPASSSVITVSVHPLPLVSFNACNDAVTTIDAKPIILKGGLPLGGTYSGPGVNSVNGIFDPQLAGPGSHQILYTFSNYWQCYSTGSFTINTLNPSGFNCGEGWVDPRDNQTYPTLQVGTQCWFAANLNFGTMVNSTVPQTDNCIIEKYCASDDPANCLLYGGFYQWDELMRYQNTSGAQGICPPGWHVPTESDWSALFNYYGGKSVAAGQLTRLDPGEFRALPAGVLYQNQTWTFTQPDLKVVFFWSSDAENPRLVKTHGINNRTGSVSDYFSSPANGFSTRCLKD